MDDTWTCPGCGTKVEASDVRRHTQECDFVDGAGQPLNLDDDDEAGYAWVIFKSWIDGKLDTTTNRNSGFVHPVQVDIGGPSNASQAMFELVNTRGKLFRIYDDDGVLYYEGRVYYAPDCNEDYGNPLEDWGTPGAGATSLRYYEDGKWTEAIS